jgi:very-long-chain enoyl-CoA reductase
VITYIGLGVYVVGIVFNFSHHRILALLRTDSQTYTIPQGGLFNLVVCPHFLFEMTIWLGIFLVSRHYAAFLFFGFAVAYLSARALRTLRWYHERFPDFPKERKAVFPFIL